jgi:hypothetical protein
MTHKWPFRDHEEYVDRPRSRSRADFGIQILE